VISLKQEVDLPMALSVGKEERRGALCCGWLPYWKMEIEREKGNKLKIYGPQLPP